MYSCNLSKLQIYNWKFHLLLEMIMVKEKKNTRFSVQNDYFLKGYIRVSPCWWKTKKTHDGQAKLLTSRNKSKRHLSYFFQDILTSGILFINLFYTHTHARAREQTRDLINKSTCRAGSSWIFIWNFHCNVQCVIYGKERVIGMKHHIENKYLFMY